MVPVTVKDPVTGIVSLILSFDTKTEKKLPFKYGLFSFTLKTKSLLIASREILLPITDVFIPPWFIAFSKFVAIVEVVVEDAVVL